jgi:cyclophilin family peptidyl-prolyl cis-trans isomerase
VEDGKPRLIKLEETGIKHDQEGVVAMARSMDPDSASCQFFIDLTAQPGLEAGGYDPHGYAAFGQVIEGMDVVHKIANENEPMFPGDDGTTNPVTITEAVMLAEANAN